MTARPDAHQPEFTRLERHGPIIVRGADAPSFLQGQLTCDVNALAPARAQHGGYCTARGRLLATFLIWRQDDGFRLLVPGGQCAMAQKQLSKFILRAKATVVDGSGDHVCLGVSGDGAAEAVKAALGIAPVAPYEVVQLANASAVALPVGRYVVIGAAGQAETIEHALSRHAIHAQLDAWNWQDIRAGIPEITAATQEEFVPQMVNLDRLGGISFAKGCYTGQEIVARMHYLGRLKQRAYLVHLASDIAPQAGDKLYSARFGDQACGMILRTAPAPGGGYDALAVMQIEEAQDGNVRWRVTDGPTLDFLQLPYSTAES